MQYHGPMSYMDRQRQRGKEVWELGGGGRGKDVAIPIPTLTQASTRQNTVALRTSARAWLKARTSPGARRGSGLEGEAERSSAEVPRSTSWRLRSATQSTSAEAV